MNGFAINAFELLGWLGNACFFARFLVQWLASERAKSSVAPPIFWWMSLGGSLALGAYAARNAEYVLLVGYAFSGLIYTRNLWFQRGDARPLSKPALIVLGALGIAALAAAGVFQMKHKPDASLAWMVCGALGMAIWNTRFVVQWIASERAGESHFPRLFWWLSLAGNVLLLAYTLHVGKLVLIAGYVLNPIVQIRNLMLGRKPGRPSAA